MAKYFKVTEIDSSTFKRMTGEKLGYYVQVSMLANDGTVYLAVNDDKQDYIEIDIGQIF